MIRGALGAALVGAACGCADTSRSANLTVEQRDALETFELDARRDEAFRAAAGVMIDQGMIVSMSDFGAGLVSGAEWGYAAGVGRAQMVTGRGVVVWVRPGVAGRTLMRVRLVPDADPEDPRANQFVQQVRERVLIAAAPKGAAP